jgi:predicted flap endonuclease-1-like 5' DNA nuclease
MYQSFAAIYSDINPKDKSTAIAEILILMGIAFALGYLFRLIYCKLRHEEAGAKKVMPVVSRPVVNSTPDDLTVVEGIGPKINDILHEAGIRTYDDLASSTSARIQAVLDKQGPRYQMHNPASWPAQSALARDAKWDELESMKEKLTSGRV